MKREAEVCDYCYAEDHGSYDHRSGIDKRQDTTIGTRWWPESERALGIPEVSCILGPYPSAKQPASPLCVSPVDFYTADQTRKHRLDPFLPALRICYECRRELLPDEQLPPLRASWGPRDVLLFFCDECAKFGPIAPVSECFEALSTADRDCRREAREALLAAACEQRQKVVAQLRAEQARNLQGRIQAAWGELTPTEEMLIGLELWIRNIADLGILTKGPVAEKRLEHEREIKAEAKRLEKRLMAEGTGRSRVDTVLVLYVEFNKVVPKMTYPGNDAMGRAITGKEMDEALSIVANRIDGELPARSASPSDPLAQSVDFRPHVPRHGYVADAPAERKERERVVVANFMLSAHKAEFDGTEQNLVLTWLGGAKQTELSRLSGWSQPTVSRLLRRVLERAVALQLPLSERP